MNEHLQQYARDKIKEGLSALPLENHRVFKLMYARDDGRRSVDDALAMDINQVVDQIPPARLDWAMQQVSNSLAAAGLREDVWE